MRALLLVFLVLHPLPVKAADQVLAPSGTLRAAYIVTNVAQARLNPANGTISGVIADVARELGRRATVPVNSCRSRRPPPSLMRSETARPI